MFKFEWNREKDQDEIREKKRGVLFFRFYNLNINELFECLKKGYKIIPLDLTIHRMGEIPHTHEELGFLMGSKSFFATGFDNKKAEDGIIELDHEKKEIRFVKKIKEEK